MFLCPSKWVILSFLSGAVSAILELSETILFLLLIGTNIVYAFYSY